MTYHELFAHLKSLYNPSAETIHLPWEDIEIHNCAFKSEHWMSLPGAATYSCQKHNMVFQEKLEPKGYMQSQSYPETLKHADVDITENKDFTFVLFKKSTPVRANGVILLFHGLNERSWDKYLPWAYKLVSDTGRAVVLFPIAFHMNRAPVEWGKARHMKEVSDGRRSHSPAIMNSSFANAAISERIEQIPQRFFWSGLQTFDDIVSLISNVKDGLHPFIAPDATFDLFGYSIGSFLGEILLMANPNNYFQSSRFFMFCGGPTLDRMFPNSKFILDSDATIAIYSFYTERLETELVLDQRIAHFLSEAHPTGSVFKAMLSHQKNKDAREKYFSEMHGRIRAIALKKDHVIPPAEVLNTLMGEYRDICNQVEVMDFPFPYTHATPFPTNGVPERLVDASFDEVFKKAAEHFH